MGLSRFNVGVAHAWRALHDLGWNFHRMVQTPQFRRAPLQTLSRLAAWSVHCISRRPAVVTLRPWGCRLLLPAGRRCGSTAIYLCREDYEPELRLLEQLLPPRGVFIDVGASVGVYSVVASKLVGSEGTVLAFEPGAETYPVLVKNVNELNSVGNVETFQLAVSDAVGSARLYHVIGASLYSLAGSRDADEWEPVRTTALDHIVRERQLPVVSCIKIDAEGAETLVLHGAAETLSRFRPVVIFEVNDYASARFGLSAKTVMDVLRRHGYRFERIGPSGLVPLSECPESGNVLARPD